MLTTGERKLATYNELQTVYDTSDMYDLLEMQDVSIYLDETARKKAEQEHKNNSNKRR